MSTSYSEVSINFLEDIMSFSGDYEESGNLEIPPLIKPDLPIPFSPETPEFNENYSKNFRGAPDVDFNYPTRGRDTQRYPFVTSIIIESEQGEPNLPTYINNISDFIDEFGDENNVDFKRCISFLQYSPSLLVTRCVGVNSYNSSSENFPLLRVDNFEEFTNIDEEVFLKDNNGEDQTIRFIAKTPGKDGNRIRIALFTSEEVKNNAVIYKDFKAKDIINGLNDLNYCIAIFKDYEFGNKTDIKEIFVLPFNNVESINIQSNYVYCKVNAYNDFLDGMYDGNEGVYEGNVLFADGDVGRYYYGYDGNVQLIDGNIGYYDGEEFNSITFIRKFFGQTIIKLQDGITEKPTLTDLESTAEILGDIFNYLIDLHIANNVCLYRDDVVNILDVPKGVEQAIDFKNVFDIRNNKKSKNFFVYGKKFLDKEEHGLSSDYAGLRSLTVLEEGLGVSSSKITKTFKLDRLKTTLSASETDLLFEHGINSIKNYKGTISCIGEVINA